MTTYALIDTRTNVVLQVSTAQNIPVSGALSYVTVPDSTTPGAYTWNPTTKTLVPVVVAAPVLWYVLKLTIRTRLQAASLEAAADAARAQMPLAQQGLWNDTIVVPNDDADMAAFLKQIGADATTIMAYDPEATRIFGRR